MSTSAQRMLTEFKSLAPAEQREVAAEILKLAAPGDIPEVAYEELPGELFQRYDAEEATRGDS